MRNRRIPSWLRLFIWVVYLGNDGLATHALATLFSRHKKLGSMTPHEGGSALQLGGQYIIITAYNIEDNELWRRNILTALS
uniref:DUF4220 domain-containing protein n=1 Tax=Leersia perrieri TaxID=77586 RepID=A0A0D9XTE6_9ORYZ